MAESDGTWDWLNLAAQEAREVIDRLYREGHNRIAAECPPPARDVWPAEQEPRS